MRADDTEPYDPPVIARDVLRRDAEVWAIGLRPLSRPRKGRRLLRSAFHPRQRADCCVMTLTRTSPDAVS